MRHSVTLASLALLAGALGGAWWWFNAGPGAGGFTASTAGGGKTGGAVPKAAPPPVLVEAAEARVGTSRRTVLAVGTFRSFESVMIRPELASRVKEFNFTEGQKVAKGQVLVRLDAAIDEATLAQAEAALALSRANYERAVSLVARQAGTEKAVDESRAALRRDEAAVQLAKARVEKFSLTAPFDGVVGLRKVSIGSYLQVGADIVNLEQIDPLKVDFRVPETFLAAVKVGQAITLTVDAFAGRAFDGKVYAIDPLVDEAGRSVVIRAQVDNAAAVLRPGVFARVALTLSTRENALFVPEQAIVPVGDRLQVYRVIDGRSTPTFVSAGQRDKGEVEIVEGLKPGDVVITAGHLKLSNPGMRVTIVPAGGTRPPGGAPPAAGSKAEKPGGAAAPSTAKTPGPAPGGGQGRGG
ncbi:MAG: efflux RND transporter periplasmic adaptor subunit [Rhodospirillales bacterium]|nr:MAG: efflux RND transporter periplasmic adaptor subunit [Rhodospirillales bacterium]